MQKLGTRRQVVEKLVVTLITCLGGDAVPEGIVRDIVFHDNLVRIVDEDAPLV